MRLPAANQTLDDDGKGREDGALCRRSRRLAHLCAAFAVALPVGVVVSCAAGQVPDLPGLSKTIDLAAPVWWQPAFPPSAVAGAGRRGSEETAPVPPVRNVRFW